MFKEAADKLKENSKTSDDIAASTVKSLLPTIMNMLLLLLNLIFKGSLLAYPSKWVSFINAIPKKGRLEPPKFVRFISVMGIFEKLYQTILRLLKILTIKTKQKLFIVFTDFEAAFDLVSRKLLFEKLIKVGVSTVMLNALIAMYISSKSGVEHGNEFSDYLILLAGIKQGAPTSGLLYIAYTLGLIDIFDGSFKAEPLIYIYHLLMHADDILMLATSRHMATEKHKCLMKYCKEIYIKLQI